MTELGNLKEAESFTRKAIEIKSDFANAHYLLGNILLSQGNYFEGIKHLKQGKGFIEFNLIKGLSIN